jgi:hypothetical protein
VSPQEVTDLAAAMNPLADVLARLVAVDPALALSLVEDAWDNLEDALAQIHKLGGRIDRIAFEVALEEAVKVYEADPAGYTYNARALPVGVL